MTVLLGTSSSSAIANFGQLKTAIASWLNRSDLTSNIPLLVGLAEQRIYYGGAEPYETDPVRVPDMQAQASGTITSRVIPFPENMLEVQRISASVGGIANELQYVSQQAYTEKANSVDTPRLYTFSANEILVDGSGAAGYTLDYVARYDGLEVDTDTNWILSNAPAVYLYGALLETAPLLYDDPRIQLWFGMYKSAVGALNRTTPKPTDGTLRVFAK